MNITEKYNFQVVVDQFGNHVSNNFCDYSENELIFEFEKMCIELLNQNKDEYTMIELGSNQAYYSLLFKFILKDRHTNIIMVEPAETHIDRGRANWQANGLKYDVINKCIGPSYNFNGVEEIFDENKSTTVDIIMKEYSLNEIDILHSDIDGYELEMLETATNSLSSKKIKNIVLCTHDGSQNSKKYLDKPNRHELCLEILKNYGYSIVLEFKGSPNRNVGGDGLIIAKI